MQLNALLDNPHINIFGFKIYAYAIIIVCGMIAAFFVISLLFKRRNMSTDLFLTYFCIGLPVAILTTGLGDANEEGVIIPISQSSARDYHMRNGDNYETLGGKDRYIDRYLLRMGVPCRYLPPEKIRDGIVALDSYSAGFLSGDALNIILSKAVFIDGGAAMTLVERGFGDMIGISELKKQNVYVNAEIFSSQKRADGTYIRVPSRIPCGCWFDITVNPRVQRLSKFLTPDGKEHTALIYFENSILDPFSGGGTSLIEAQRLGRNAIGIELQEEVARASVELLKQEKNPDTRGTIVIGDSRTVDIGEKLQAFGVNKVQFVIFHPPYWDIIKFSENEQDLSNCATINEFNESFGQVIDNTLQHLEKNRYCACVIGDKYAHSEIVPLGFYCLNLFMMRGLKLKAILVKNFEETKGKANQKAIWRYRALASDFYLFKHEYIFVFKKVK